jgi:hypothetical protein
MSLHWVIFSVFPDFIFSASEDDSGTISENCIGEYSGVTRYNSKNLNRFVIDNIFRSLKKLEFIFRTLYLERCGKVIWPGERPPKDRTITR